jgi:hypothetical protein
VGSSVATGAYLDGILCGGKVIEPGCFTVPIKSPVACAAVPFLSQSLVEQWVSLRVTTRVLTTTESSTNLICCLRFQSRSGRKDFLPVEPQSGLSFLFRLSEPRFALNHSFILSGSRQIHSEPTDGLRCKSAVCGLNGLLPRLARSRDARAKKRRPRGTNDDHQRAGHTIGTGFTDSSIYDEGSR